MKAFLFPTALSAIVLAWRPLLQGGGDLFGVSRTIDHAVYTLLNSAAIILWRLNAALISMSLFSYNTQDWLTNRNSGGVWQVMEVITGPGGLLGIRAWMVMLSLALTLFGLSLLLRPFAFFKPVDLGKMLIFGVFSYVVIQQGASLMVEVEQWRAELGDYMYEGMAASGSVAIDMPGLTPSSDPLYPPADLDGQPPIRGWEAVSASYFLVTAEAELNDSIPPADFRRAYCLYDPAQPISDQTSENSQGCSPQKAWDEWDYLGSTGVITAVWGIELPISLGYELPILEEHPENRELAIRQAQGGVARLALGPIVALYPMLEANISLLLALSAAILYLTVPIILLFGFFLYTQPMVSRLLMRFITITINTIILNGLIALFLLLLVNVSVNGSLSAYLGLVGVAVLGGFILTRVAMGTLKETLSVALGAIGGAWMGATTATMGREAAPAARGALGAAKLVGTGALLGAAGMSSLDLAEGGLHTARSGLRDLDHAGLGASGAAKKQAGQLPAPLARLAREGLETGAAAGADPMSGSVMTPATAQQPLRGFPSSTGHQDNGPHQQNAAAGGMATLLASGAAAQNGHKKRPAASSAAAVNSTRPVVDYSQAERQAVWQTVQEAQQQTQYTTPNGTLNAAGLQVVADRLSVQAYRAFQGEQGQRDLAGLIAAQQHDSQARGWGVPEARQGRIDSWLAATYQARSSGQDQMQTQSRELFGEQLGPQVEQVVARRGPESVEQGLAAVRRAAVTMSPEQLAQRGQLTPAGRAAVQSELPPETAQLFQGRRGQQDLDRLAAAALQPELRADARVFRQVLAAVQTDGRQPPAAAVARRLGLDPVAAGPHYAGINRFVQAADQAGLTAGQRERLVTDLKTDGQLSPELQAEIEAALARQVERGRAVGLDVQDLIGSAQALPDTLSGPALPGGARFSEPRQQTTSSGEIPQIEYASAAGSTASGASEQTERRQTKPFDIAQDRLEQARRETATVSQTKSASGEQQMPVIEMPQILTLPVAPGMTRDQLAAELDRPKPARSETGAAIREEAAAAGQPANVTTTASQIPQMQPAPEVGRTRERRPGQQDKPLDLARDTAEPDGSQTAAVIRQSTLADQSGPVSGTTPKQHPASAVGAATRSQSAGQEDSSSDTARTRAESGPQPSHGGTNATTRQAAATRSQPSEPPAAGEPLRPRPAGGVDVGSEPPADQQPSARSFEEPGAAVAAPQEVSRPPASSGLPASGEIPQIRAVGEARAVREQMAGGYNEVDPTRSETAAAIREESAASRPPGSPAPPPSGKVLRIQPADEVGQEAGESGEQSLESQQDSVDPTPDISSDPPQVKLNISSGQTAAASQPAAIPGSRPSSPEQPKTPSESPTLEARPEVADAREPLINQSGGPEPVRSAAADRIRQEAAAGSDQSVNPEQTSRPLPSGEFPQIQPATERDTGIEHRLAEQQHQPPPVGSETAAAIREEAAASGSSARSDLPPSDELPWTQPPRDDFTSPSRTTAAETRRQADEQTPLPPLATSPVVESQNEPAPLPATASDTPIQTATEPLPEQPDLAAELRRALAQEEADIPAGSGESEARKTPQQIEAGTEALYGRGQIQAGTKTHQPAVDRVTDDSEAEHKTPLPPLPTPAVRSPSLESEQPTDKAKLDNSTPVIPADAHDQAGAAAAALGRLQQEASSGTEAQQIAAALREQAKADLLNSQTEPEKRSGGDIKAAALAAAGSDIARVKLSEEVAGPPTEGPSAGVAAALRRGRVDDEDDEVKTKGKAEAKAKAEEKPEPERETGARPLGDAGQNISSNREPVVSLLPHHKVEDSEAGLSRFVEAATAESDQAEIAADLQQAVAQQKDGSDARSRHPRRGPFSTPDQADAATGAQPPAKRWRAQDDKAQQRKIDPAGVKPPTKAGAIEPESAPPTTPRGRAAGPGSALASGGFTASIPAPKRWRRAKKRLKLGRLKTTRRQKAKATPHG